jgi:hypothetical protein
MLTAFVLGLAAPQAPAPAAAPPAALPTIEKIRQTAERFFAAQADYRPGDIISRGQVEALLKSLTGIGFAPPGREKLLADVPADDDFLVARLRTPKGKQFMRRVAGLPQAYDRLDRLSRLPQGQRTVEDLIKGPGGDELIRYMTSTPGGNNLGKQLANGPKGADFNKPTGKLYTADALLTRLSKLRDAMAAAPRP